MGYLVYSDFDLRIQPQNLEQIINGEISIQDTSMLLAEAEAKSYLVQKYNIDAEFSGTGATRNIQLVTYCVDLALYHIHTRISPRNVPELRVNNYNTAITWLKMASFGDLNVAIEKYDPTTGQRIRHGGNPPQPNVY
jgi:phage gp36-like protein